MKCDNIKKLREILNKTHKKEDKLNGQVKYSSSDGIINTYNTGSVVVQSSNKEFENSVGKVVDAINTLEKGI